jgi:hypothetical protein
VGVRLERHGELALPCLKLTLDKRFCWEVMVLGCAGHGGRVLELPLQKASPR